VQPPQDKEEAGDAGWRRNAAGETQRSNPDEFGWDSANGGGDRLREEAEGKRVGC
jgi:hypothetical protein